MALATASMSRAQNIGSPMADPARGCARDVPVAIGRRFVVEATRSFDLSEARARAAAFTWEQITERVPGYTRVYGAEAAEVVFNEVAVPAQVRMSASCPGAVATVRDWCSTVGRTEATRLTPSGPSDGLRTAG